MEKLKDLWEAVVEVVGLIALSLIVVCGALAVIIIGRFIALGFIHLLEK